MAKRFHIKIDLKGAEEVQQRLRALAIFAPDAVGAAMQQEAELIKLDAMERTPVADPAWYIAEGYITKKSQYRGRPGTLKRSATVEHYKVGAGGVSVKIGYGAPYALFVHENLKARHPSGENKFLEKALKARAPILAQMIGARTMDLLATRI